MDEERLRSALRQLDDVPAPHVLPEPVKAAARARRTAYAAGSVAALCVAVAAGITLVPSMMDTSDSSPVPPAASRSETASTAAPGQRMTVSIEPHRIGSLEVSVSEWRDAPVNDSLPWREHDLVFTNTADETLHVDDTRTSAMLTEGGRAILLAGDEGCGYGRSSKSGPVEAGACDRYLDAFSLRPGESTARTITLWKELAGMSPLEPGVYEWVKTLRFSTGDGPAESYDVTLTYEVQGSQS